MNVSARHRRARGVPAAASSLNIARNPTARVGRMRSENLVSGRDRSWTFDALFPRPSWGYHQVVVNGRRLVAALAIVAGALLVVAAAKPFRHAVRTPHVTTSPSPSPSEVVAPRRARPPESRGAAAPGQVIGTLTIPRLHETETFRQGVGASVLQYGPGHYPMTHLPGEAGTVAIAGHRTTHTHPFLHLNDLRANDRIFITAYGRRFVYRVYAMKIVRPTDVWVLMLRSHVPRLVLTACHPPHLATFRIVVFARQIGPVAGTPLGRR